MPELRLSMSVVPAFYVHFSYGSSVYGVNRDMHIRAGANGGQVIMGAYFYSVSLGNVFL